MEVALKDSAVPSSIKIVFTRQELVDVEVKTPYYFFRFNDGKTQWTYHIDATNGDILFSRVDQFKELGTESGA